ncbi:MAG: hypothetical protein JW776_08320 [Candidatus Lokiarchaeota archaeon]|nr:hypothetical protein [Candidatus Lokiarchaeota archaeon]
MNPSVGKLVYDEELYEPIHGMGNMVINYHFELNPDRSTLKNFEESRKDLEDFFEWFEKKQQEMEKKYYSANGEAKIAAAKELIRFLLDAYVKWGEIQTPSSGKWNGFYTITARLKAINFNIDHSSDLSMVVHKSSNSKGRSNVTGTVTNGISKVDAGSMLKGKLRYLGEMTGYISGGKLSLIVTECIQDLDLKILGGLASGTMTAFNKNSREGISGLKKYKLLVKVGEKQLPMKIELIKCGEQVRQFDFEGYEEFEFDELLRKYFTWLVHTTDEVRTAQFSSCSLQEKMELAMDMFTELLNLLAKGQSLGIPQGVLQELNLITNTVDSLYDKWFRMWFIAGRTFWEEKVNSSPSIANYKSRFYYFLSAAELNVTSIVSKQPFRDFKITLPGEAIDAAFIDYYNIALQDWLERVTENPKIVRDAVGWVVKLSELIFTKVISESAGKRIGLIPLPPTAYYQLYKAAGIKGVKER